MENFNIPGEFNETQKNHDRNSRSIEILQEAYEIPINVRTCGWIRSRRQRIDRLETIQGIKVLTRKRKLCIEEDTWSFFRAAQRQAGNPEERHFRGSCLPF